MLDYKILNKLDNLANKALDNVIGNTRRIELQILYEGKNITKYIHNDLLSFTQSDSLNEFDTLDLSIQNREGLWISSWAPLKGEKLEVKAYLHNWEVTGVVEINIGTFYIDNVSYSGPPDVCNIKALSVDITSNLMDNKKNRVWENVTLEKVASDIAKECNLELIFEVDFKFEYKRVEARLESYFNFLKRLGKEAGILVKLYNDKLILLEETLYEDKEPIMYLSRTDLKSYSFETDDTDRYAGCKISYYDSKLGKKIEKSFFTKQRPGYKRGTQRVLFINEEKEPPGATKKQKEEYLGKIAEKALREKNKDSTRGNIQLLGKEQLLSVGNTIYIVGFGIFEGKYLISKIDTNYKDYTLSLDIRKVEEEE